MILNLGNCIKCGTVNLIKISNWELVLVFRFGPALVRLLSWVGFLIFIKIIFQIWKYVSGLYSVKICFSAKTVYWNHATATFTDLSYYMHAVLASLVALLTGAQNKTRHCLVAIRIYIQKWVGFISGFRSLINPLYVNCPIEDINYKSHVSCHRLCIVCRVIGSGVKTHTA